MKAEIRYADADDLEDLLAMGRSFFDHSSNGTFTTFDPASLTLTLSTLMSGVSGGVLLVAVAEGRVIGMAACMVFPFYANHETLIGQEIFLWVNPEHRGAVGDALLDELEAEAMRKGAKVFINANLAGPRDKAFARYYRRRGYVPAENTHIRILSS